MFHEFVGKKILTCFYFTNFFKLVIFLQNILLNTKVQCHLCKAKIKMFQMPSHVKSHQDCFKCGKPFGGHYATKVQVIIVGFSKVKKTPYPEHVQGVLSKFEQLHLNITFFVIVLFSKN
jgi:hypothetical protein